jgi:dihydroneopterin aldolase
VKLKPLDKIRLTHMVIYAHHGAHEEERTLGQRFEIDVELGLDTEIASKEDRLERCVDYGKVYQKINEAVTEKKFYLIEALAQHVADKILHDFDVMEVTVRVRKPSVPIKGSIKHVEVEITREKK